MTAAVLAVAVLFGAMPQAALGATAADPRDDPQRVDTARLSPSADLARRDKPLPYSRKCHASLRDTEARACVGGDRDARRTIVVLGDSHAVQWWSAVSLAAKDRNWRLVSYTKAGCPAPYVTVVRATGRFTACNEWRRNAIASIRAHGPVHMVVLGGSSHHVLWDGRADRTLTRPAERAREWERGITRLVSRLDGAVSNFVLLRDTPSLRYDVPRCLDRTGGDVRACQTAPNARVLATEQWRAEKRVAGARGDTSSVSMTRLLCSPDWCRGVTSTRVLRYRDDHHLTDTFVRTFAGALGARLDAVD